MEFFTADFFKFNRDRLVEGIGSNLIVLAANGLLQRSADTTFPFRQDSNFWYLTGIDEPDYALVINGDSTFLIAPKRHEHRDQWDGTVDRKALKTRSGVSEIEEYHEGWVRLDLLVKKYKKVHTIVPAEAYIETFGFYANPSRGELLSHLKKHRNVELVDIRKNLARMRQIKQTAELQAIQSAIDITTKSIKKVQNKLHKYKYEHEIEADLTREFIYRGASGHGYQPIVACGKNAATIHYIANNQALKENELLLLDIGAEVNNYSADITRTFSIPKPSSRQRDVHEAVKSMHAKALEYLKPGVNMREYEKMMDKHMAKELKKLKLLDDIEDKKKLKKYYPHLTSHFLGLDVHDAADYEQPLAPGMVLTVEPGIYIPNENIGIRIEDDVLVTKHGVTVLSSALPIDL